MPRKVDLDEKFAQFSDHWAPRVAGRYNGNEIRLVRAVGDFQWHCHPDTDEPMTFTSPPPGFFNTLVGFKAAPKLL